MCVNPGVGVHTCAATASNTAGGRWRTHRHRRRERARSTLAWRCAPLSPVLSPPASLTPCVQAYMGLVRETKNQRLQAMMEQTDACLRSFSSKLGLDKLLARHTPAAGAAPAGRSVGQSEHAVAMTACCQGPAFAALKLVKAWNTGCGPCGSLNADNTKARQPRAARQVVGQACLGRAARAAHPRSQHQGPTVHRRQDPDLLPELWFLVPRPATRQRHPLVKHTMTPLLVSLQLLTP